MTRVGSAGGGNETTTRTESAIGARLRSAREARKLTDEAASAQAQVPLRYLRMLEAGSFPTVADPAYLTHFLRRYAAFLRLDAEACARDFLHETEPETAARLSGRKPPELPRRRTRRLPPGWAVYGAVLLTVLGSTYGFVRFQQEKEAATREITRLPEQAARPSAEPQATLPHLAGNASSPLDAAPIAVPVVSEPIEEAVQRRGDVSSEPVSVAEVAELAGDIATAENPSPARDSQQARAPAATRPVESGSMVAAEPAPAVASAPPAPVASAPPAPVASAPPAPVASAPPAPVASAPPAAEVDPEQFAEGIQSPFELVLTATSRQVWIWVSIDDGPRRAVSLRQGESVAFRAEERYVLSVDDAGGIEATLNGESLPSFGGSAQARRNVVIPSSEFGGGPGRG